MSHSGSHIATASKGTDTIFDARSHTPPRLIKPRVEIWGLLITGNVLSVFGPRRVEGWLVMGEESPTDGPFYKKWAIGRIKRLWTFSTLDCIQDGFLGVEGHIAQIENHNFFNFSYNMQTGRVIGSVRDPRWYNFYLTRVKIHPLFGLEGYSNLRRFFLSQDDGPPNRGEWLVSRGAMPGWFLDPEGRHRLWVPIGWRELWDLKYWHHEIATLFIRTGDQLVIIKL